MNYNNKGWDKIKVIQLYNQNSQPNRALGKAIQQEYKMEEVESGRVTTAAGDDKLKEIFISIRTSKSPVSPLFLSI